MTHIARRLARGLLLAATVALAGCGGSSPTATGRSEVRVRNASNTALIDVAVTTGEGESRITLARLEPGAQSSFTRVAEVHSHPIVQARVGDRPYTLHPIEGFIDGFNPPQPEGRYTVELTFSTEHGLGVRLVRED